MVCLIYLDVLIRTNILDSHTYVWKEGMSDWKKIYQIDELKDIVQHNHTEITESITRNKIQTAYSLNNNPSIDNYYLGADSLWHIYDHLTKEWTTQETVFIVLNRNLNLHTKIWIKSIQIQILMTIIY